ncbi:hypothetical protein [uncultured Pseudodesulfovibrio sp.]|uniref:hypothetical protein n=1 Tax=uncultured Pseudodesulfovibrio sp. TaxID=2035858 RepID=UPI0029C632A4|nr:hypothetical protein [uncultured Pseudodesulfovibrio sp.]
MSDENRNSSRNFNKFWPHITNPEVAHYAASQGVWACGIICGFTVLNTIMFMIDYPDRPVDLVPLVKVALFGLIGIGIHKKYKASAITGLVLYLLLFILKFSFTPIQAIISSFFAVFFTLAFINSVRGVHKWHALKLERGSSV